jgi:hypothetical protein
MNSKEILSAIKGIKFPVKYDKHRDGIYDADNRCICNVWTETTGGARGALAQFIAAAINSLQETVTICNELGDKPKSAQEETWEGLNEMAPQPTSFEVNANTPIMKVKEENQDELCEEVVELIDDEYLYDEREQKKKVFNLKSNYIIIKRK